MFTGIIQEIGKVVNFSNGDLEISTALDLSDCKIGSSICCNGVCLTAKEINFINQNYYFKANVGEETIFRSNFSENLFNKSIPINLEKSLKMGDEISGHYVYGHVDCVTKIKKINRLDNSWEFVFDKNFKEHNSLIVEKGSISINGISLTIAKIAPNQFIVSIIQHTFDNTNLKFAKQNDFVNIEFDYLARYILNKHDK